MAPKVIQIDFRTIKKTVNSDPNLPAFSLVKQIFCQMMRMNDGGEWESSLPIGCGKTIHAVFVRITRQRTMDVRGPSMRDSFANPLIYIFQIYYRINDSSILIDRKGGRCATSKCLATRVSDSLPHPPYPNTPTHRSISKLCLWKTFLSRQMREMPSAMKQRLNLSCGPEFL